MSARRVVLLRHARTAHNAEGRFQGQSDSKLDETGRAQAQRSAGVLAAELDAATTRIVSSDLSRASDTARALAARVGVDLTVDARLREIHGGVWEGRLQHEIKQEWPAEWELWRSGDALARRPGGESRLEAGERAREAIVEHAAATPDGFDLVVVLHGACAKAAALLMTLGPPPWNWFALESPRNAHWAELHRRQPGDGGPGWQLSRWNVGPSPA